MPYIYIYKPDFIFTTGVPFKRKMGLLTYILIIRKNKSNLLSYSYIKRNTLLLLFPYLPKCKMPSA